MSAGNARKAALGRRSRETELAICLSLDGGAVEVSTGIGFLDHLVASLALHAGWGLELACSGDLDVDDHHSSEDCALALGEALARALARGGRIKRFGSAYAPLDEALARAAVDVSGRPYCRAELGLGGACLGGLAGENAEHFLSSLAAAARITLHVDVLAGKNAHHRAEASFKALALALKEALSPAIALPPSGGECQESLAETISAKGGVLLEALSPDEASARAKSIRSRCASPGTRETGGRA